MKSIKLKSIKRDLYGRKVKKLRKEGLIPANIFGKKIKSQAISVDANEFEKVFKEAGETQIIDLSGKPVLVSNVTSDPVSDLLLHIDFRQVDLTQKVTAQVPVEVIGESPAEKQSLGTVVVQIDEVEVEALPADLPEKLTVDISILEEVDQAIFVKNLKVSSKVVVKEDKDSIVVKVEPPQKEEEVVAPKPVEGEVPAESTDAEAVADKGETPVEPAPAEEPKAESNG